MGAGVVHVVPAAKPLLNDGHSLLLDLELLLIVLSD